MSKPLTDPELRQLFERALSRANQAFIRYGTHDSCEFTCCRIAEEAGELVAAATSQSHGRETDRRQRMEDEAADLLAMVVRLFRSWPDGRVER